MAPLPPSAVTCIDPAAGADELRSVLAACSDGDRSADRTDAGRVGLADRAAPKDRAGLGRRIELLR